MTPSHVPAAFFTVASLVLAGSIFVLLRVLLSKTPANLCLAGFLACLIPAPMMLVVHTGPALAMAGLGLACLIPAIVLAEDIEDEGGGGGGARPEPVDPAPDPGFDPDLWDEFERDFWSHVDQRTRELVHS